MNKAGMEPATTEPPRAAEEENGMPLPELSLPEVMRLNHCGEPPSAAAAADELVARPGFTSSLELFGNAIREHFRTAGAAVEAIEMRAGKYPRGYPPEQMQAEAAEALEKAAARAAELEQRAEAAISSARVRLLAQANPLNGVAPTNRDLLCNFKDDTSALIAVHRAVENGDLSALAALHERVPPVGRARDAINAAIAGLRSPTQRDAARVAAELADFAEKIMPIDPENLSTVARGRIAARFGMRAFSRLVKLPGFSADEVQAYREKVNAQAAIDKANRVLR